MPLAFLLIFGGALLAYMGWKNESFQGILNDTLSPISQPTSEQSTFASGLAGSVNTVGTSIGGAIQGAAAGIGTGYFTNYHIGRTDQGVDISGTPGQVLPAIGTSRVVGIIPNWYKGQPFVWLQALDGPLKGRYYYYAEQITNVAPVGSVIQDKAPVGHYANSGTAVEVGLATASGSTLAKATTGYTEGQVTQAGSLFKRLLGLQ